MTIQERLDSKGILKTHIAEMLDMSRPTLQKRLKAPSTFTVGDAVKIRDEYFPNQDIGELFKEEEK